MSLFDAGHAKSALRLCGMPMQAQSCHSHRFDPPPPHRTQEKQHIREATQQACPRQRKPASQTAEINSTQTDKFTTTTYTHNSLRGVTASTLDPESSNRGSNPREGFFRFRNNHLSPYAPVKCDNNSATWNCTSPCMALPYRHLCDSNTCRVKPFVVCFAVALIAQLVRAYG